MNTGGEWASLPLLNLPKGWILVLWLHMLACGQITWVPALCLRMTGGVARGSGLTCTGRKQCRP